MAPEVLIEWLDDNLWNRDGAPTGASFGRSVVQMALNVDESFGDFDSPS